MKSNLQRSNGVYQHIDTEEGVEMPSNHHYFSENITVFSGAIESSKRRKILTGMVLLLMCILVGVLSGVFSKIGSLSYHASSSIIQFDDLGRYIMKNYDEAKPMSNFLPALGGLWVKLYSCRALALEINCIEY